VDFETKFESHQWSEGQCLQQLEELEKNARDLIDVLKDDGPLQRRIQMRFPRHIAAMERLTNRCRAEIECFGLWREDEADIEDICDELWEEAQSIADEVYEDTAMSWGLDSQELAECVGLAKELLACERYLSGSDLDFLHDVVSGEIFDTRWLQEIAANHGRWFKL